mmetsp:Transcript_53334/g.137945  ORF Transcript_53334/g.137945 Transcript_53334/m.137945 type:complete len:239 (+) Transcript_53334:254-970(+)
MIQDPSIHSSSTSLQVPRLGLVLNLAAPPHHRLGLVRRPRRQHLALEVRRRLRRRERRVPRAATRAEHPCEHFHREADQTARRPTAERAAERAAERLRGGGIAGERGERRLGLLDVLDAVDLGILLDALQEELVHGGQSVDELLVECVEAEPRLARGDKLDIELWTVLLHEALEEQEDLLDIVFRLLKVLGIKLLGGRERALELARGHRRERDALLLQPLVHVRLLSDHADGANDGKR